MVARRRKRSNESTVPEVNLVPMMDVLMSVLTFFIIISMSLSSQSILTVEAPEADGAADSTEAETVEPFVLGLNADGEILISDEPVDRTALSEAMREYYANTPDGYIRLKADRELEYRDVSELLITLRDLGGGRVALAYE
ncbi:MAG: biopolymer transporter ExbD [Leptolyngbyaceae bacterium]|nr:biopolymer transporter ExbD [Leptolyngbyaceae bacterium]